jgi:hypothetical protein
MIYHSDIWGGHKHIVANCLRKLFISFAVIGALLWSFGITLAYGTYLSAVISIDYFIIAIDSRAINLTDPSQPPNDRYCKIWPLADDVVFFTTGAVSVINNGSTRWGWTSTRDTVEGARSLDINRLNRAGCLRLGLWGQVAGFEAA